MKSIKELLWPFRYRRAVRRADRLAADTSRRYLVLVSNGKPFVVEKRKLKSLINRRFFKRGTTIQDIERMAVYRTINPCKPCS